MIEAIILDGAARIRVTRLGYLVGRGYYSSEEEVGRLLAAHGIEPEELEEDDPDCE